MTLSEVVAATGVSAERLIQRLNLPPDIDGNEKLGRLAEQLGVDMRHVREAIAAEQAAAKQSP